MAYATRNRTRRERTNTGSSSQLGSVSEETNPFIMVSQSFAPYSQAISSISGTRHCANQFSPATVRAPAVSAITPEPAVGSTIPGDDVYETLYNSAGDPITVLTPRHRRTVATPVMDVPPMVLFSDT